MSRFLSVLMIAALLPTLSYAGWGDILNSAERVDKLINSRPAAPPPAEPAEPSDDAPPPQREERRATAPRSGDDAHFIQSDDYFISDQELGSQSWMWVTLSKLVTQPSSSSKDEGEFMTVKDGQNKWTGVYWQSRIAGRSELKLGMHIIAFNDNQQKGVYQAPSKKDRARGGGWFYAKITDMSDMYKGFVTVSGNYKVGLSNIRVPLR